MKKVNNRLEDPVIESSASIGAGTTIGEFSYIGKNVTIGKNNTIEKYVIIEKDTIIGDDNFIAEYAVVGSAPQDIKTKSKGVYLEIGSKNHIGSYTLLSAGTDHGGMVTKIGNNNSFADGVHVGHDVQMEDECQMEKDSALGGHITIGSGVVFEESVAVHQFVNIGHHSTLLKDAALTQDIPPFCIASGNRAKIVGIDTNKATTIIGKEAAQELKDAFDYMNESGHSQYEYARIALDSKLSETSRELYDFIASSKRGVPFSRRDNVN